MICPRCGGEYRDGFYRCADCDVDLIYEMGGGTVDEGVERLELVTISTVSEPGFLLLARSILEGAEIPCFTKNEGVQSFFGAGQLGTGFNLAIGPVELQVPKEEADRARSLLQDLAVADSQPPDEIE